MNTGQLRPIADDEVELVRTWRNAPGVRANMYTQHEISRSEHEAWWARTRERTDQKYFIYEHEGLASGVVAFTAIDPTSENAAWAFYAAPSAPPGTGSRMEFVALEYAFAQLSLNKLYCEVLAFNTPVIRLHHKFGFETEGVFRQQQKVDGAFVDVHRLGLLAAVWAGRRLDLMQKVFRRESAP